MAYNFSIFSLNARGLGNNIKRRKIFDWLIEKGKCMYLLQECHSETSTDSAWKSDWHGNIEFSHGTTNSRGVAILLPDSMQIIIEDIIRDNAGKFLLLDCLISETHYIIVNIYAPTSDKKLDQAPFGAFLFDTLQKYPSQNIIIGGEFNLNLEDHECHSPRYSLVSFGNYMSRISHFKDLIDIWKIHNTNKIMYTRRENTHF